MDFDKVFVMEETKYFAIGKGIYRASKRMFDIFCSIVGLFILIPIAIITKIAFILKRDFESIWFKQERIGQNGKLFNLYKFRSMCKDADLVLEQILENDLEMSNEYKINKKLMNDPRITSVGKILRKTSLDEIPQFINVFKGNMSLIGNRPYLPREKQDMGVYYETIVATKPGITGYWQTHGRSDVTFVERLELEKYYSLNYNAKMDIKIFFKTIAQVIKKDGAK